MLFGFDIAFNISFSLLLLSKYEIKEIYLALGKEIP